MKSNVKSEWKLTTNWYGLISQHSTVTLTLVKLTLKIMLGIKAQSFNLLICSCSVTFHQALKNHLHQLVNQSGFNITITEALIQVFMMLVLGKRFSSSERFVCLIEEIVLGNSLVGGMLCSRSTTSQGARRRCCGTEEKKHFNVVRKYVERKYAKKCSWKNCNNRLRNRLLSKWKWSYAET